MNFFKTKKIKVVIIWSLLLQMILSPFLGTTVSAEESLIKLTDANGQKIAQTEFSTDDLIYLTFLKNENESDSVKFSVPVNLINGASNTTQLVIDWSKEGSNSKTVGFKGTNAGVYKVSYAEQNSVFTIAAPVIEQAVVEQPAVETEKPVKEVEQPAVKEENQSESEKEETENIEVEKNEEIEKTVVKEVVELEDEKASVKEKTKKETETLVINDKSEKENVVKSETEEIQPDVSVVKESKQQTIKKSKALTTSAVKAADVAMSMALKTAGTKIKNGTTIDYNLNFIVSSQNFDSYLLLKIPKNKFEDLSNSNFSSNSFYQAPIIFDNTTDPNYKIAKFNISNLNSGAYALPSNLKTLAEAFVDQEEFELKLELYNTNAELIKTVTNKFKATVITPRPITHNSTLPYTLHYTNQYTINANNEKIVTNGTLFTRAIDLGENPEGNTYPTWVKIQLPTTAQFAINASDFNKDWTYDSKTHSISRVFTPTDLKQTYSYAVSFNGARAFDDGATAVNHRFVLSTGYVESEEWVAVDTKIPNSSSTIYATNDDAKGIFKLQHSGPASFTSPRDTFANVNMWRETTLSYVNAAHAASDVAKFTTVKMDYYYGGVIERYKLSATNIAAINTENFKKNTVVGVTPNGQEVIIGKNVTIDTNFKNIAQPQEFKSIEIRFDEPIVFTNGSTELETFTIRTEGKLTAKELETIESDLIDYKATIRASYAYVYNGPVKLNTTDGTTPKRVNTYFQKDMYAVNHETTKLDPQNKPAVYLENPFSIQLKAPVRPLTATNPPIYDFEDQLVTVLYPEEFDFVRIDNTTEVKVVGVPKIIKNYKGTGKTALQYAIEGATTSTVDYPKVFFKATERVKIAENTFEYMTIWKNNSAKSSKPILGMGNVGASTSYDKYDIDEDGDTNELGVYMTTTVNYVLPKEMILNKQSIVNGQAISGEINVDSGEIVEQKLAVKNNTGVVTNVFTLIDVLPVMVSTDGTSKSRVQLNGAINLNSADFEVFYSTAIPSDSFDTNKAANWQSTVTDFSKVTMFKVQLKSKIYFRAIQLEVTYEVKVPENAVTGEKATNIFGISTPIANDAKAFYSNSTVLKIKQPAISGIVYEDLNGNGVKDAGEIVIANRDVFLYSVEDDGRIIQTKIKTNEDGYYEFRNLTKGNYEVEINLDTPEKASNYNPTTDDVVKNDFKQGTNTIVAAAELNTTVEAATLHAGIALKKKGIVKVEHHFGEDIIENDDLLEGYVDDPFTTEEKAKEGYILESVTPSADGIFTEAEQTIIYKYKETTKNGIVKVEHHYGTEVEEDEPLEGLIGSTFETEEKVKEGYVLESVTPSASGVFKEAEQTVIYKYKEIPKKGIVKVEHHYGTQVEKDEPLEGLIGNPFKTEEKVKEGYVLESVTPSASGIFTEAEQIIIYKYKEMPKKGIVKVEHHYGTQVEKDKPIEGIVGKAFKTTVKPKVGYKLESVTPSATGVFTEGEQTIIYQYKLIVPPVDPNESTDPGKPTDPSKPTESTNSGKQNDTTNQLEPGGAEGGANPITLENGASTGKFAELLHLETLKKQQLAKERAEATKVAEAEAKANLIRKNQLIAAQQAGENKDDLPQTNAENTNMWGVVGISLIGLGVLFIGRRFKLNNRKN